MVYTLWVGGIDHGGGQVSEMCHHRAARGPGRPAGLPPQILEPPSDSAAAVGHAVPDAYRGAGFSWRHWLKWTMAVDVDRQLMVAQTARSGPTHDDATRRPLVDAAHQRAPIPLVLAEAECDSERHHQPMRQILQAQRVIPAKRGRAEWQMHGVRARMRQVFPVAFYRWRALLERLSSAVKRTHSARAPGRSLQTPGLQALRLGIASNISRLWWFAWIALPKMSTEPDGF